MCNALDERAAPCVMKVTSSERFLLFPPNRSLDRAISPAREPQRDSESQCCAGAPLIRCAGVTLIGGVWLARIAGNLLVGGGRGSRFGQATQTRALSRARARGRFRSLARSVLLLILSLSLSRAHAAAAASTMLRRRSRLAERCALVAVAVLCLIAITSQATSEPPCTL